MSWLTELDVDISVEEAYQRGRQWGYGLLHAEWRRAPAKAWNSPQAAWARGVYDGIREHRRDQKRLRELDGQPLPDDQRDDVLAAITYEATLPQPVETSGELPVDRERTAKVVEVLRQAGKGAEVAAALRRARRAAR